MSRTRAKDLTGQQFGRWTVVSRGPNTKDRAAQWKVVCIEGNKGLVRGAELRAGTSSSCGCLRIEHITQAVTTHGMSKIGHYLYRTWLSLKQRCDNPNNTNYHNYGGRGITYDPRWSEFISFRDYIMSELGERPDGYSIDRIDNDGNYEPGNVRWADASSQLLNQRRSRKYLKKVAA